MPRYDASTAECFVFTYKEGLLSALGHDLRLRVSRFEIEVSADPGDPSRATAIAARFDACSLVVDCALRADGADNPGALSAKDRRDIEENIVRDVLHSRRHPEIRFASSAISPSESEQGRVRIAGKLSICGGERPLIMLAEPRDRRWVAEATLHQPDFGIRPFSALLGAMKIKPDIRVRVSLPRTSGRTTTSRCAPTSG